MDGYNDNTLIDKNLKERFETVWLKGDGFIAVSPNSSGVRMGSRQIKRATRQQRSGFRREGIKDEGNWILLLRILKKGGSK